MKDYLILEEIDRTGRNPNEVLLRIIHQDRRLSGLLEEHEGQKQERFNGWKILSRSYPEINGKTLFVQGHTPGRDDRTIHCPKSYWPYLKEAIRQLNEKYTEPSIEDEYFERSIEKKEPRKTQSFISAI